MRLPLVWQGMIRLDATALTYDALVSRIQMVRCRRGSVVLGAVHLSAIRLTLSSYLINGGVCGGGNSSNRHDLVIN